MKHLITAAAIALLATPALAGRCPAEMSAIDAALAAGTSLSAEDLARVQELRAEGERLHGAGDHAASVAALDEAKAMLGI